MNYFKRLAAILSAEQIAAYVKSAPIRFSTDAGALSLKACDGILAPDGVSKLIVLFDEVTIDGVPIIVTLPPEALTPGFDSRSFCVSEAKKTLTALLTHPELIDIEKDQRFVPPHTWKKWPNA
jgi:hypothetical protein